jgi:hypothetical protein
MRRTIWRCFPRYRYINRHSQPTMGGSTQHAASIEAPFLLLACLLEMPAAFWNVP